MRVRSRQEGKQSIGKRRLRRCANVGVLAKKDPDTRSKSKAYGGGKGFIGLAMLPAL